MMIRVNQLGIPDRAGAICAPAAPDGLDSPVWTGAQWVSDPERYALAAPTLDEIRAARCADVDRLAKAKRDAVVADVSAAEMASWPIKRSEALAWQASGLDTDAPKLAREATARKITLADLVAKVLAKADRLAALEADIAGHCGYLQDQIRAAADQAAIEAIDINAGWPI